MVKIAQVIVDVPLMQTDKPFSYIIPKDVEDQVTIGSRVHVPFGRGNRLLQGFVVGFSDTFDNAVTDLKAISEVLDFEPVLNAEQLELAEQMRHTVFSYKISILKSMIPNLLNSQYDKRLTPTESLSSEERLALFGEKEDRLHSSLSEEEAKKVARLVQAGKITVDYLAKDKKNIKTEKYYHVQAKKIPAADISNRAKKRLELRDYLLKHPEEGKLSDLHHLFSRDVVKFFVDNQLITVLEREKKRSDAYFDVATTDFLDLNAEQAAVVEQVTSQIGQESNPFLLEGVTGSGKTEVYLHIIDKVLKLGKTAIVLVPEISLTPQMTNRFISRFGKKVAIMHSALSDGEKFDEWRKIKSGQARVVVGARSAIFVPIENIGAIIIDEEHEATYKQESNPRYHARDVALLRAKYHKAVLLMGSATPSIESRARASRGVYQFLQLTHRANPMAKIPKVEIVDFRDYVGQQEVSNFTPYLLEKIADRLEKNEQVVLMLNRRGYSSFIMCRDCGYVDECPNCDISLTLHMDTKTMNCHYCGFEKSIPHTCPNCHSRSIRYYGTGTQKAYDELVEVFPQARILRMDVDTTRQKGAHQRILDKFGNHEANILLGTQMIAKGLDFPNVTLVGVLNADTSLNLPDFRSSERTFQLLTQVAGRAGRAEKEGEVLIQTYNPQHYAIQLAQKQDYEAFYAYEMGIRRQLSYPPYYFTVGLTLSHKDEQIVVCKSSELLQLLRQQLSDKIKILGPTPKPIARTHNLYHYQIIVKYRFEDNLENVLNQILDLTQLPENKDLRLVIDYEPQNFM
ncbi:primosomal protein N' [Streptococcus macedonicus]|uniref:Replication restart protein PriA n=2 Tax=Streptococcus TaxID=1301 RepID=A0A380K5Y6_9STRE|nr:MULTISPECIES: primosomal protein N' [Streptococcus]CCF01748.1 Helicase PriA essential for oriC/DnaA-independent DNA replication [Streptococcus macedonicus ACA-DC 198]ALT81363.1 primosomal protein N' [Streptococcus gallolyticus]MCW8519806.1 primosomal protein N' [Streptococcus macedonicus]MCW8520616.1 primosomal protein N' [Streptococcus macedonicus]MCW8645117.1 primosomal protein N' [Streptococcus macedonicus]